MNYRLPIIVCTALFTAGTLSSATAGTKVLEYDKSGKAKVRSQEFKGKALGKGKQQLNFTNDPSDPVNHFQPGELVVLNAPAGFTDVISGMGYRVLEGSNLQGLGLTVYRVQIPRGRSVPEAQRELSGRFPGATVDANHRFEAQARKVMHARGAMGWPLAPSSCGSGIKLGQIDSGVDTTHSALKGQRVKFRSFHAKGARPGPKIHGTAVAAMLVGKSKWGGLLPGAELLAASMFQTAKDGRKVGTAMGLLKSLNWLAKSRVHAINLSVAGTDNKTLRLAFDKARKIGLVLIAAAGNWGRADRPAYPAAYKHVIAVTAVSTSKKIYSYANTGDYIDFAAPGVKIYAAVPGGAKLMTGTSFASPYITAMIAADIAAGGSRRDSAIRKSLGKEADDLGSRGKDATFGYGFVKKRPGC
ncbi:MAG: S8 family serine peptidase [Rhodospirillaceae bacterium]|nr:S8 family serine peptidase [Rhodospirillaceae bacterium]